MAAGPSTDAPRRADNRLDDLAMATDTQRTSPLVVGSNPPRNFAKSASRALDVLAYMAQRQSPARAREIAHALGASPSSMDQLLKTMVSSGYLVLRFGDKAYFPSPKLGRFAGWMRTIYSEHAQVEGLLTELHRATGQVVLLSTECDYFMEVQSYVLGDAAPGWSLWPGRRVPILESAIGGALLAGRSDAAVRRLFDRARRLRPMSDPAVADRVAYIMRSLKEFRRLGYAWRMRSLGQNGHPPPDGDVMSIAVGLKPTGFGTGMVLGLAGLERDLSPSRDRLALTMHQLAAKHGLAA